MNKTKERVERKREAHKEEHTNTSNENTKQYKNQREREE
jgi:hypothetical protein